MACTAICYGLFNQYRSGQLTAAQRVEAVKAHHTLAPPILATTDAVRILPIRGLLYPGRFVRRSNIVAGWNAAWAWLPVPAMAAVLIVVVGSQISSVVRDINLLAPVIPVYIGFLILAPLVGALASRMVKLPATTARAVTFSASTRNSLVVLPLALTSLASTTS